HGWRPAPWRTWAHAIRDEPPADFPSGARTSRPVAASDQVSPTVGGPATGTREWENHERAAPAPPRPRSAARRSAPRRRPRRRRTRTHGRGGGTGPTCQGEQATIVGTSGPDRLAGSSGRDVIVGLGGGEVISGRVGDDLVWGAAAPRRCAVARATTCSTWPTTTTAAPGRTPPTAARAPTPASTSSAAARPADAVPRPGGRSVRDSVAGQAVNWPTRWGTASPARTTAASSGTSITVTD
ncbi:MAG: calcium-binding protein, partial [Nocardioides sp.]|nr:calcium-binding protein [Nocardioides sp.]